MTATAKVGDPVIHHGHLHHITSFPKKAVVQEDKAVLMQLVTFENERFSVDGFASELVWSDEDGAWFLPGRLLARNERAVMQAITGSWPPAENHHPARAMLDTVNLEQVNRDRLGQVLKSRKRDVREGLEKVRAEAEKAGTDVEAAERAALDDYVTACLAQVGELRAARKARGVNHG